MNKQRDISIVQFLFELEMMKREKHSGATLAGVVAPNSIGEHIARAALIGFILASYERADPYKTSVMLLLHDLPECRIGDHHKVASRYLDTHEAEARVMEEQLSCLDTKVAKELYGLYLESEKRTTPEGVVAKDADWLEMALQARTYITQGYTGLQTWIENIRKALETDTARRWLPIIDKADPNEWWKGLKKMTYQKLTPKQKKGLSK